MAIERESGSPVRNYLEYFRDLGIYDFYCDPTASERFEVPVVAEVQAAREVVSPPQRVAAPVGAAAPAPPFERMVPMAATPVAAPAKAVFLSAEIDIPKPVSFNDLAPLPAVRVLPADRPAALAAIQTEIGDCTRCPLAYGGRHTVVFGDGDPAARLMFVGEGPGADEDAQGLPFVGKSGQLLNNMIAAMGLKREQVYIANIVKCRPPANRAPEPAEANVCTQFLVRQMDVVQPEFVVALGATAAMYLLGVKQSLGSLRGRWHEVRGSRAIVTYHPAFLLRDPRQKAEAWKDLQMVMAAMKG
jgi:DNA polymerase